MYNIILDVETIVRCFHNVTMCDIYLSISVMYYGCVPVYVWLKVCPRLARLPCSPGNHHPEIVRTLMVE
jgi:hypothetical protein